MCLSGKKFPLNIIQKPHVVDIVTFDYIRPSIFQHHDGMTQPKLLPSPDIFTKWPVTTQDAIKFSGADKFG